MSKSMCKVIGPDGATFEFLDTAGVCSLQLDGVQVLGTQGSAITSLTDNSGGTANNTITAVGGITTLTDSTGYDGTHSDTLSAVSVPADITGGDSPTEAEHNAVLAVLAVIAQNQSNGAQKTIEIVADLEDCKNNFADLAAKVNAILAALRTTGIIAT